MVRILAGEKKGRLLRVARTAAVRPITANARQVLFDILGQRVVGARWLDLYSGSGAAGLEALSRGAAECVLVESSRPCLATIRANVAHLGYEGRCRVIGEPVEKALRRLVAEGQSFDLIFLDPPYRSDEANRCLLALGGPAVSLASGSRNSIVVARVSARAEVHPAYGALVLDRERRIGDARLCFYRLVHEAPNRYVPQPSADATS